MLLRHSATYLFAQVVPSMLSLLGIAIYTRMLGPDDYGLYALAVSGAALAQVWFFEWLRLSTLRLLPQFEDRRAALTSSIAAGFLIAGACAGVLGLGALLGLRAVEPSSILAVGILLLWAQALFGIVGAMTRADLAPHRFALITVSSAVLMLTLGVLGLLLGLGPVALVAALTIAQFAAVIRPLAREWPRIRLGDAERGLIWQCWRYGLPLSLASGFGLVVMSSDRFMIAWLLDTGAAGGFAAAYELARHPISALMSVVSYAAFPLAIHRLERAGPDAARVQLQLNLTLLLAIGLPATVGLALVADDVVAVMLGVEFREAAATLIPWIALAALLHGITAYHFDVAFQLGQTTMPMAWISLMTGVLNLSLNYWWIQSFGVIGAAYASVASYMFAMTSSAIWGRRAFALPRPDREVLKIVAATAVMAAVVWAVTMPAGVWGLAVRIATGAAAYGAAIWALNLGGLRGALWMRLRTAFAPRAMRRLRR